MAEYVSPELIEVVVGTTRRQSTHMARAISSEERLYVLHSRDCLNTYEDLLKCPFSVALDNGISPNVWSDRLDEPVQVFINEENRLEPRT